jgi:hypothetical protein
MRIFLVFLASVLLAAEPPKLPEPYRSLVDLAQAAPPEFAADALLRIVESRKITSRDIQRDLVEQAFRLATTAKFPLRMKGLPGTLVDTRSGFLSRAYDLKLDALSLESRAVTDLLAVDVPAARELFQEIPLPALAPLTCDDAMVYDVDDFYLPMAAIVNSAFTPKERAKEEHVNFLLGYLGQATSPAQLAPLARVIKTVGVTKEQREILWNRFNGLLETLQSDDRSYAATLGAISAEAGPEMQISLEKYKQRGQSCKGDRAAPSVPARPGNTRSNTPESTPKLDRYWQSEAAKRIRESGLRLRSTADGHFYTDAERATQAWQERLADFMGELAEWTPDQEQSEADYYHEKCIVFEMLVELTPPGAEREKTLGDFVDFISNSDLQQQSPVEWFMQANSMLERVRPYQHGELAKLLEAYEHSGNPVLALAVTLESVLGSKAPGE